MPRIGDRAPSVSPRELADRLDEPEMAAGRAGLADRQLPARGIDREGAVPLRNVLARMKSGPSPLPQKPRSSNCSALITG